MEKTSVSRGLKNTDPTELNNNILVDTGLAIVGKKIKSRFSPITGLRITLIHNKIKDAMKVIKSLQNKKILLKETTHTIS